MKSERPVPPGITHTMSSSLCKLLKIGDKAKISDYIVTNKNKLKNLNVYDKETHQTLFAWLVKSGNDDALQKMLETGCVIDVDALNEYADFTAKFIADRLGKVDYQTEIKRIFGCHTLNINMRFLGNPLLFVTLARGYDEQFAQILCHPLLDISLRIRTDTILTEAVSSAKANKFAMLLAHEQVATLINQVDNEDQRRTPLVKALQKRSDSIVASLMNRVTGQRFDIPDCAGNSAITLAAGILVYESYALTMIKQDGDKLSHNDAQVIQAIKRACIVKNDKVVKAFIDAGLHWSSDILTFAYKRNQHDLVNLLLNQPQFNPYFEIDGDNYVTWAIRNGYRELFDQLRALPAFHRNAKRMHERSYVTAIVCGQREIANEYRDNYKIDPNCRDHNDLTVLHHYAALDYFDALVAYLQTPFVFINTANHNGTILHTLIRKNIPLARYLDLENIDLNAVNNDGDTPLNLAIKLKNWDACRALLEKHAVTPLALNQRDAAGKSPLTNLFNLPWKEVQSMIALLLQCKDIDVTLVDAQGKSLLMLAAERGIADMVARLLAADKSNVNSRDGNGDTALMLLARHQDNVRIAEMLISDGAEIGDAANIAKEAQHECLGDYLTNLLPPRYIATQDASAPPSSIAFFGAADRGNPFQGNSNLEFRKN